MVNEDILGGIENAVAKGEPIEAVMMGFYNSGYTKEDIEWAAKAFQLNKFKPVSVGFPQQKGAFANAQKTQPTTSKEENPRFMKKPYDPKVKQHVSGYDDSSPFKEKVLLIVLVSSLILLLGILAAVFVFKEQLVNFINSLFIG